MSALLALVAACDRAPAPSAPEAVESVPIVDSTPSDARSPTTTPFPTLAGDVIASTDTLDTLRARHGEANVVATKVPGAEGEEFDGWLLYPDDASRRIHVYLDDAGKPSTARLLDTESTWQREDGIRMGMTLAELVEKNGAPIGFLGFDWDYGGGITNWNGGRLQRDPPLGPVQLCPPETDATAEPGYPAGDAEFDSGNAWVVAHPPTVCEFSVNLTPWPMR